jgi:RNA polymerase sigma-70 factor (ECF subfamily)
MTSASMPVPTHVLNEGGDGADESSLVRAAQDDPTAFAVLYHRYFDRVYAYVRARTATEDDAADLTQQVFLHALDALPRYRGARRDSFAAWLFRIARNVVTDAYRRRRATITWDLVPEALQPATEHDLDEHILRREARERLRTLFETLDPAARELLVLRFVARLSIADIAAVIGKKEDATQKKLSRLIHTLKEQYHADAQ